MTAQKEKILAMAHLFWATLGFSALRRAFGGLSRGGGRSCFRDHA
jgi:hypothetical protein